jgi:rhodanese-related sulfurtransferase
MILVTEPGKEKETIIRLARVGFSKVIGYVKGGFEAWKMADEPIDMIIDVEADEMAMDLPFDNNMVVVDVRKPAEYADGHVKEALNLPLNDLTDPGALSNFEEEQNLYLHCAGGYRSVIAASLFKRQGIHNLRNVLGGWSKIKEQDKIPTEKEKAVLN